MKQNSKDSMASGMEAGKKEQSVPGEEDDKALQKSLKVLQNMHDTEAEDETSEDQLPWVDRKPFNAFMSVVILINAMLIGVETDDQMQNMLEGKTRISDRLQWYIIENIFLLIFLGELTARLAFAKATMDFFKSQHNMIDLTLVVLNIIDTWIFQPTADGASLRTLTVFRIIRIFRLARMLRILSAFTQLYLLIRGVILCLRTLFWTAALLFIFLYTAAIYTTLLIGQNDASYNPYFMISEWDHEVYFGTLWRSMFTMFQVVTLDKWAEHIVRHIAEIQPTIVGTYGILNLIVGVIVESSLAFAKVDSDRSMKRSQLDRKLALSHLKSSFERMDADGSGSLTLKEIKDSLTDPEIATRLKIIDFPVHEPEKVFNLIDVGQTGEIDLEMFIKGCVRLSGQAQSRDMLELLVWIELLGKRLSGLEEKILLITQRNDMLELKTQNMYEQSSLMFSDAKMRKSMMSNKTIELN